MDTLPRRNQTTFGGGPFRNASCRKSESFDTMTNPWSAAYSQISTSVALVETNAGDVLATRELDSELPNKVPGQVLVEQKPHAGVASRRSRNAANSIAARTCAAVNPGKSATISSTVMPDAR